MSGIERMVSNKMITLIPNSSTLQSVFTFSDDINNNIKDEFNYGSQINLQLAVNEAEQRYELLWNFIIGLKHDVKVNYINAASWLRDDYTGTDSQIINQLELVSEHSTEFNRLYSDINYNNLIKAFKPEPKGSDRNKMIEHLSKLCNSYEQMGDKFKEVSKQLVQVLTEMEKALQIIPQVQLEENLPDDCQGIYALVSKTIPAYRMILGSDLSADRVNSNGTLNFILNELNLNTLCEWAVETLNRQKYEVTFASDKVYIAKINPISVTRALFELAQNAKDHGNTRKLDIALGSYANKSRVDLISLKVCNYTEGAPLSSKQWEENFKEGVTQKEDGGLGLYNIRKNLQPQKCAISGKSVGAETIIEILIPLYKKQKQVRMFEVD